MKKVTGAQAPFHYDGLAPEYTTMSRRPGIGAGWLKKFQTDVFPDDFIVMNGRKVPVPKAYNRTFEILNPEEYAKIKHRRIPDESKWYERSTLRLAPREAVQKAALTQLKRAL